MQLYAFAVMKLRWFNFDNWNHYWYHSSEVSSTVRFISICEWPISFDTDAYSQRDKYPEIVINILAIELKSKCFKYFKFITMKLRITFDSNIICVIVSILEMIYHYIIILYVSKNYSWYPKVTDYDLYYLPHKFK